MILFYWKLQLALLYPLPSSREREQTEKKGAGGDSFFWTVGLWAFNEQLRDVLWPLACH